jgi:hypothetical protein
MSAALGLLRLQKVDSSINQVQARLEQIRETLENNTDLAAARARLENAERAQEQAEHTRQARDSDTRSQQLKIQQAESSLYGGSVRSPKELQDLQADVESIKRHLATTEELEFESMVTLESAEVEVRSARAELDQVEARLEDKHRQLIAERETLVRELGNLHDERKAALGTVAVEHLQTYERIAEARRGVAVAEISDNACRACGTTLTAAQQQNARHTTQLVFCPSCGRILFAG